MTVTVQTFESNDPFTLIESRLWESIERHSGLMRLIPKANRIKWNEQDQPEKEGLQESDTPQLSLIPLGGVPSTSENVTQTVHDSFRWGIGIKSNSRQPCKNLFPIIWQFWKCMCVMGVNFMEDVGNLEFVIQIDVVALDIGRPGADSDAVKQMGLHTWLASAVVTTDIRIPVDVMLEDN